MPLYSVRVTAPAEVWEVVRAPDEKHARAKALAMARHPHSLAGDDWTVRYEAATVTKIVVEEADDLSADDLPERIHTTTSLVAGVDDDGRLTVHHVHAYRDHERLEHTLCELVIPRDAEPAPADAPVCHVCQERDA